MKRIFFFILSSIVFFSCSDTAPLLNTVQVDILYDYEGENLAPELRLSVFVQLDSEVARSKSITVSFAEEGYTWNIDNPSKIQNSKNGQNWMGSSYLLPAPKSVFSPGQYRITYRDLASRESVLYFTLPEITPVDVIEESEYTYKTIAIFDAVGELLYYGNQGTMVLDNSLLAQYPTAVSVRTILVSDDGITKILKAPQFLFLEPISPVADSFNTIGDNAE